MTATPLVNLFKSGKPFSELAVSFARDEDIFC